MPALRKKGNSRHALNDGVLRANRANLIYNRIFPRSRAPQKFAKIESLGLGPPPSTYAHDYFPRFFGVAPKKKRERAIFF